MLKIDLTGKRAFVAGVADDGGFGFAIAKAMAEAGATICLGTWPPAMARKVTVPFLMVSGAHDKQVAPDRVRELYTDVASAEKVFVDLACSSHNAMWERNHLLLFRASLEWLTQGTVNGMKSGMLKLGYDAPRATQ